MDNGRVGPSDKEREFTSQVPSIISDREDPHGHHIYSCLRIKTEHEENMSTLQKEETWSKQGIETRLFINGKVRLQD